MRALISPRRIRLQIVVPGLLLLSLCAGDRTHAMEEELPCAEEIAKYCKGVRPGGGRILDCLNEHQNDLSASCRRKLEESRKRLMEAQQACTGDMERFCKDVRPGEGRILKCLREHAQDLTPACSQVIDSAPGKAQEIQPPAQQEKTH